MNRLLRLNWFVLLCLFALALAPRLAGLNWGLPSSEHWFSFHPDERQIVEAVSQLRANGDLNPHFFNYPSLFLYATWLVNMAMAAFSAPPDATLPFPWPEVRGIMLAGRLVCALSGAAMAPLAFAWARRVISRRAALLAGILCALSPGLVQHSHFATVDVPATFFVVWCLYLTTRGQTEGDATARRKYLLLAALVSGLAAATKYNAVLVALAPLTAAILLRQPPKYLLALCALPIVGFVLGCPYSVLDFREFWGDPARQQGVAYELLVHPREGSGELFEATGNGWLYHLGFTLPFALTWPVLLASVASLAVIARKKNFAHVYLWPIAAFAVLYFGAIGTSQVRYLRYILPLAPPLLMLAAALIDVPMRHQRAPQVLAGALVLFSVWGTRDVVYPFVQPDAREQAVAFLRSQARAPLPQSVALADDYWFYSPPLLPANIKSATRLPATSPDGLFRVDNFGYDAARLLSERPNWIASGEFEWREKARLRKPEYLAWDRILNSSYSLAWSRHVQAPMALPGRSYVPHDFLYPNPEVRVYKSR